MMRTFRVVLTGKCFRQSLTGKRREDQHILEGMKVTVTVARIEKQNHPGNGTEIKKLNKKERAQKNLCKKRAHEQTKIPKYISKEKPTNGSYIAREVAENDVIIFEAAQLLQGDMVTLTHARAL